MKQFDIRKVKGAEAALIVVLQHDALAEANTVIVAPLLELSRFKASPRLHPRIRVNGIDFIIGTELLLAMERKNIGDKVDSAVQIMDEIKNALDLVFLGF
jgi:hypothetical protein